MKLVIKRAFLNFMILSLLILVIACDNSEIKTTQMDYDNELIITQVEYDNLQNQIIGSEMPRIIYADNEKVVFDSGGIYIYDLINQKISSSLDIWSFKERYLTEVTYDDVRLWTVMLNDGNEMIITFPNLDKGIFEAIYTYDVSNKTIEEISENEYDLKKDQIFQCEYLKYDDDLYGKSTGMIANIDNQSYVYLRHTDFRVDSIQIVVKTGNSEVSYDVFSELKVD